MWGNRAVLDSILNWYYNCKVVSFCTFHLRSSSFTALWTFADSEETTLSIIVYSSRTTGSVNMETGLIPNPLDVGSGLIESAVNPSFTWILVAMATYHLSLSKQIKSSSTGCTTTSDKRQVSWQSYLWEESPSRWAAADMDSTANHAWIKEEVRAPMLCWTVVEISWIFPISYDSSKTRSCAISSFYQSFKERPYRILSLIKSTQCPLLTDSIRAATETHMRIQSHPLRMSYHTIWKCRRRSC